MAGSTGKVTLADVATRAQVDRSVVSRVLNEDPRLNIRPETRARVLAAIDELSYRPNAIARSLRTQRAGALGLLIPDFANPIYAAVIAGAEFAAARRGLALLIGSLEGAGPRAHEYLELLDEGRVDGVLLVGADPTGDLVSRLEAIGLPWMLVVRRVAGAHRYVILDDERAAAVAVAHLVECGHERIAHIAGEGASDTGARRRAGYLRAAEQAGVAVRPRDIAEGDYTYEGGARAMAQLLAAPDPPTAVLAANLASAIGALAAIREAGFAVPEEVSVVAIHDLPLAAYVQPPLTTVRMPVRELGERAIELLLTTAPDEPVEEVVTGEIELVVRGSTAPPPQRSMPSGSSSSSRTRARKRAASAP
jgi:LacI family transcriptional regulator